MNVKCIGLKSMEIRERGKKRKAKEKKRKDHVLLCSTAMCVCIHWELVSSVHLHSIPIALYLAYDFFMRVLYECMSIYFVYYKSAYSVSFTIHTCIHTQFYTNVHIQDSLYSFWGFHFNLFISQALIDRRNFSQRK